MPDPAKTKKHVWVKRLHNASFIHAQYASYSVQGHGGSGDYLGKIGHKVRTHPSMRHLSTAPCTHRFTPRDSCTTPPNGAP